MLVYIRYYTAFVSTAKNTLAFSLSFICTEGAFIVIVCILVNVKYPKYKNQLRGERGEGRGERGEGRGERQGRQISEEEVLLGYESVRMSWSLFYFYFFILVSFSFFLSLFNLFDDTRQRRMFEANSEVLSPLVTARSKKSLESFLRRLSILTVVSCLIFLQVLLFIPGMNKTKEQKINNNKKKKIEQNIKDRKY